VLLTVVHRSWPVCQGSRYWVQADTRQRLELRQCTADKGVGGLDWRCLTTEISAEKQVWTLRAISVVHDLTASATNNHTDTHTRAHRGWPKLKYPGSKFAIYCQLFRTLPWNLQHR